MMIDIKNTIISKHVIALIKETILKESIKVSLKKIRSFFYLFFLKTLHCRNGR